MALGLGLGPAPGFGGGGGALSPQTFVGSALGGFSSSNYLSAAAAFIAFAPGMTLWMTLQLLGQTAASTGTLLVSSDLSTRGWMIQREGADGSLPGSLFFQTFGGSFSGVLIPLPTQAGIVTMAIRWRASDTHMIVTFDGGVATDLGAVAPGGAGTSACKVFIGCGSTGAGTLPLTDARVLALATWATEAPPLQAQYMTFTQGNRFVLQNGVIGAAVVDFLASRDFPAPFWASGTVYWSNPPARVLSGGVYYQTPSGGLSTVAPAVGTGADGVTWAVSPVVTMGSSPLTLTVTGLPTLTAVAETRYPALSSYYQDGRFAENNTDPSGYAWVARNPYTRFRVQTDATYLSVEAYATIDWPAPHPGVGAYLNGVYLGEYGLPSSGVPIPATTSHSAAHATFAIGAGSGKVVDLWEGDNDTSDYLQQPYFRAGTYIQAVRLPTLLGDGVTPAASAVLSPLSAPAHRVVLLVDAVVGWESATPFAAAPVALLRTAHPYPTDGITQAGGASLAMAEFALRADSVTSVVAELDGTNTNTVWINLGVLDYGGPSGSSAATYAAGYQAVINGICAGKPGVHIYVQSPTQIISPLNEATPNVYGNILADYRTAVAALTVPAGSTIVHINGANGAIVSNANISTDGRSYLQAGIAQWVAYVTTTLTTAGLL